MKTYWMISQRCSLCNKLHYIKRVRLTWRSRPKCRTCGGLLVDTKALYEREYKAKVKLALNLKCNHCDKRFRSEAGLNLHVRDNHECV